MRENGLRDRAGADDRIAPVIELDELGHQVRAHTVPVALDAIDPERDAITHDATAAAFTTLHRRSWWWS